MHKMRQGLCTTPMPHLLTQPSRALPKTAICTTKLTCCDEGTITQEGTTSRGDMTQKRSGMSVNAQDGAGLSTTPMPQPPTQPSHALPKKAICTTVLTCCDEGTITREGSVLWGDITHVRKDD